MSSMKRINFNERKMTPDEELAIAMEEVINSPEFIADTLQAEIVAKFNNILEKKSMNRNDLAKRIGVTKSAISDFFNEERESYFTIKTIIKIALALEHDVTIDIHPKSQYVSSTIKPFPSELPINANTTTSFIGGTYGTITVDNDISKSPICSEENKKIETL